jgi:predicted MPP superfamily phosphohydrolase
VEVDMNIKNLPKQWHGKTVMQISDIHVGFNFDYTFLINSMNKAKAYNPDIVVFTGDYVTSYNRKQVAPLLEEVLDATVKGKIATLGILGNHDYGKNWSEPEVADEIAETLTRKGVHVLRNKKIEIDGLHFFGIDDLWGTNFNPSEAFRELDVSKANIALCHNPDVCDLDVWKGYDSWILSGHTHGGQVKPPFLNPPMLPVSNKRYAAGKYDLSNNRILYINRALGHLKQIRFNVRPEITIFTLKSQA